MSAEFWAVIGVGVAVLGLVWRLDTRFNGLDGRFNGLEARLDGIQTDIAGIKERLAAVEATLSLLVEGFAYRDSGAGDHISDVELSLQG